jgi:hypothetical protein
MRKLIAIVVLCAFNLTMVLTPSVSLAAPAASSLGLPAPGAMVGLTASYVPIIAKGLRVHPDNPLLFDFIVDTGDSGLNVRDESIKLIKYFLAALTIPDNDQWVNLSPYEKDRIVPDQLGQTDMGRDMLVQDYILKQLTASLIYPDKELGKEFWAKVYAKAQALYGSNDVPVNTFNKVWIVADKAKVYVHDNTAFVVDSHLKVMLEADYLSMSKHEKNASNKDVNQVGSQIIRDVVLPELEREINQGRHFSTLRQIYHSMILAAWYKKNLKEAFLNQVYSNKSKINGVNVADKTVKDQIYQQYLQAYKKGVFNYIKEDINQTTKQATPRKYFSGGLKLGTLEALITVSRDSSEVRKFYSDGPTGDFALVSMAAQKSDAAMAVHMPLTEGSKMNVGIPDQTRAWHWSEFSLGKIKEGRRDFPGSPVIHLYPQEAEVIFKYSGRKLYLRMMQDRITAANNPANSTSTNPSVDVPYQVYQSKEDMLEGRVPLAVVNLVWWLIKADQKKKEYTWKLKLGELRELANIYLPKGNLGRDATVDQAVLAVSRRWEGKLPIEGGATVEKFSGLKLAYNGTDNKKMTKQWKLMLFRMAKEYVANIVFFVQTDEERKAGGASGYSTDNVFLGTDEGRALQAFEAIEKAFSAKPPEERAWNNKKALVDEIITAANTVLDQDSAMSTIPASNPLETIFGRDAEKLKKLRDDFDKMLKSAPEEPYKTYIREDEFPPDFYRMKVVLLEKAKKNPLIGDLVERLTDAADPKKKENRIKYLRLFNSTFDRLERGDNAVLATPGGIDLNAKHLQLDINGQPIDTTFDPAMMAQFKRGDFTGIYPVILNITPIPNIRLLLSLKENETPLLAKA